MTNKKNDVFADIASLKVDLSERNLVEPQPIEKKDRQLPFTESGSLFVPNPKMHTEEQLQDELTKQRAYYKPFMQDLAPKLDTYRFRMDVDTWDWRMEEEEDQESFQRVALGEGAWEKVTTPHYGGPLGKAVTYYRRKVNITDEMMTLGSLFICFKGVDYIAHVFINENYVGSHEGFFAPFECDITQCTHVGENTIIVKVENDFTMLQSVSEKSGGKSIGGDKIYAATGLGYDDPEFGWHHCPPGMGIYQDVYIEARSRVFIHDIFVRPLLDEQKAEAWIEVFNCDVESRAIGIQVSVYGQNFEQVVLEDYRYKPMSEREIGIGDSLNETLLRAAGLLGKPIELQTEKGINYFKIPIDINDMRWWESKTPWLYQIQVKLVDEDEKIIDAQKRQFGMRSFTIDTEQIPKGTFYLNNKQIRLRGANTMGHEQQCVYKKDWDQLRDDLLLAKISNMNFLRLTQRPVQPEIYDYCDKLGLMLQTDLPLFGKVRRNQFCEVVRQVEEMERLVRSHPSNIVISYINEPFPNADNKPQRNLSRKELMDLFTVADLVVKMNNPDRVIKHVDGDYDPPSETIPDNHCYNIWYNGNGVDVGKLSKGYWLHVKPDWNYGCGEFGAEGLDPASVMKNHYPKEWLPEYLDDAKAWTPNHIIGAQTGKFHYCFFETPKTFEEWIEASRAYQGRAVQFITEAFRRDARMVTFAIHLFIDAFPSGWMKTIMDFERRPKPAYFAYRDALTPLMVSLRTDRFTYFGGDEIKVEAWVCNDTSEIPEHAVLNYYVEMDDQVIVQGEVEATIPDCSSEFQGYIQFKAPEIDGRKPLKVRLALVSHSGEVLHDTAMDLEVFQQVAIKSTKKIYIASDQKGKAADLAYDMGTAITQRMEEADILLIDDFAYYSKHEANIMACVKNGARAIFLELPEGNYAVDGSSFHVKFSSLLPMHFVSRDTGHAIVKDFRANDFIHWYDEYADYVTPIIKDTFTGDDFKPVLTSGNTDDEGQWGKVLAVGEKSVGKGYVYICQVSLIGRIGTNPISKMFAAALFDAMD